MFRNVLVPVDGSPLAEHALPWAVAAAGPAGAVHLVHVHDVLTPVAVEGMILVPTEEEERRASENSYLSQLADRVRAIAPDMTVSTRNVDPEGPFIEALTGAVTDSHAELVVMGTHGSGPFTRFFLGSLSHEMLCRSPAPVLFIRPADPEASADLEERPELRHLIIPLDGSELAEQILEPALQLGATFEADYQLLLVVDSLENPERVTQADPGAEVGAGKPSLAWGAKAYLDGVARRITERQGKARVYLAREGPVAEAILEIAGGDPTTGVALATHGRRGLGRLLHGSVADEVIRHAAGPVLSFHPPV